MDYRVSLVYSATCHLIAGLADYSSDARAFSLQSTGLHVVGPSGRLLRSWPVAELDQAARFGKRPGGPAARIAGRFLVGRENVSIPGK
ncbi:uncharacterized protein TrAtP1_002816 [Trichoderma atroviride]|uniref:uncharacterized protein n=1 Tax=Hypocrea atroviridis TaxID=63577 RepID=UPI00332D3AE6|nr:hypothetical protein TrAtP1_002816 [Trichoderma atroviride]